RASRPARWSPCMGAATADRKHRVARHGAFPAAHDEPRRAFDVESAHADEPAMAEIARDLVERGLEIEGRGAACEDLGHAREELRVHGARASDALDLPIALHAAKSSEERRC